MRLRTWIAMAALIGVLSSVALAQAPPSGFINLQRYIRDLFVSNFGAGTVTADRVNLSSTLGVETVVNSGFTGGSTGWTLGMGWAYSANTVVHSPGMGNDEPLVASGIPDPWPTPGEAYLVTVIVSTYADGEAEVSLGGADGPELDAADSFSMIVVAEDDSPLEISPGDDFDGAITFVSVKHVPVMLTFTPDPAMGLFPSLFDGRGWLGIGSDPDGQGIAPTVPLHVIGPSPWGEPLMQVENNDAEITAYGDTQAVVRVRSKNGDENAYLQAVAEGAGQSFVKLFTDGGDVELGLNAAGTLVSLSKPLKATGYQSSDGSPGISGPACAAFENGLCVAAP